MKNKYLKWILCICLAGFLLFLSFNRHSHARYYTYHSEIWADKAGYYMYLPATFKFQFNPDRFPDSIDIKTGHGFTLDYTHKKVLTKYTYGVALLQLPFYLGADVIARLCSMDANGFSPPYYKCLNVAAVFYLLTGLFFLFNYLKARFKTSVIYVTLFTLFAGTHLFYYAIEDTGMSHVYSFALFSMLLYLLQASSYLNAPGLSRLCVTGLITGLILIIRPTNIVFLICAFFLDCASGQEMVARVKHLLQPKIMMPLALSAFLIVLPQMIYWKYAGGSFISYSYGKEGFNWTQPQLMATWFAPNNGLFLYTPFFVLIIAGFVFMMKDKQKNGTLVFACFLLISYIFSCWWDRAFGCSFGARSYVEYFSVFSIPLSYLYQKILTKGKAKQFSFWILVALLVFFNLKITYTYDNCFFGSDWEWNKYFYLVFSPPK